MRRLFDWTACFEGQHWHGSESSTDMAIDNAKRFLQEKRPKDKPFALTVALYSPKAVGDSKVPGAQWQPMNHTRRLYDNITYERPYDVKQAYRSLPGFLQRGIWRGRYDQRWHSEEQFQESMKNYHALITQVDDACRQITDIIKSQGLWNKTMVIFTSDNGLLTGAHGLAGKWNPFEESIRVPLIIYDPRMPLEKRGTIDDSFTLNIDLAETILGAAGVTPPQVMQGRDITDLYLRRNTAPWRDEFYYEFPEFIDSGIPASEALVRKKYKYINYPKRDKTGNDYEQLFDLENDPFELVDLIHKKKRDTDATEGSSPSVAVERVLQEMQQRLKVLRDKMTEPNKPRPSDWCNDTIGWKVNQTYPI